jgi:hypothetical protein
MKKILVLLILLTASKTFAQSFEGTIRWSIKVDITDPKKKAEMEEAKRKMSDPANQAKMKELEARMNDPQMKAMMENNPQMKAQMDKALAAIKTGDMNSMFPSGIILKIKGADMLSKMEGGIMSMETLYIKDKDQTYSIDRENKTYSVLGKSSKKGEEPATNKPKITKTTETARILNYNCTKYIVEFQSNGQTIIQNVWATNEIRNIDFKSLSSQKIGKDQQIFYEEIDGVPLKMEIKMKEIDMVMEATTLKNESLSATEFAVPSDFKEVPPMFR